MPGVSGRVLLTWCVQCCGGLVRLSERQRDGRQPPPGRVRARHTPDTRPKPTYVHKSSRSPSPSPSSLQFPVRRSGLRRHHGRHDERDVLPSGESLLHVLSLAARSSPPLRLFFPPAATRSNSRPALSWQHFFFCLRSEEYFSNLHSNPFCPVIYFITQ